MKYKRSKFTLRNMVIIICILIAVVFTYQNIITTLQGNKTVTITSFKEEQFKIIWKYLEGLHTQSDVNVTKISKNIESNILSLSNDEYKQIEIDMTNGLHNNTLHDILMKYTQDVSLNNINNHRNGIVVMCNDGYIEDFNYRRAQIPNENSLFRTWEDSIADSYNPELEKNAIEKILNRTSGIIALESYDLVGNEDHIKIKELTYDSLLDVYLQEGITGLRNYQIFVPYYITDIGDIFGVPDITQGIKNDNNKIIVAQEFNLYDQLIKNHYDEIFNNNKVNDIAYRYNNILRWFYVFGVLIACIIFSLMFWTCTCYNINIEQEQNDQEENLNDEVNNKTSEE